MWLSVTWICKLGVTVDAWRRFVVTSGKQGSGFHWRLVQMGWKGGQVWQTGSFERWHSAVLRSRDLHSRMAWFCFWSRRAGWCVACEGRCEARALTGVMTVCISPFEMPRLLFMPPSYPFSILGGMIFLKHKCDDWLPAVWLPHLQHTTCRHCCLLPSPSTLPPISCNLNLVFQQQLAALGYQCIVFVLLGLRFFITLSTMSYSSSASLPGSLLFISWDIA